MEDMDQVVPLSPVAVVPMPSPLPGPSSAMEMEEQVSMRDPVQENESAGAAVESPRRRSMIRIVSKPKSDDADLPGCAHYKRKCQLVCPDPKCDKVYTCRICHDEAEMSHKLDRHGVKEVVCINCKERQPVSNCCIKCSTIFGKFFCPICNLFMDVYKDTFHCDGCGICRVGPKEKFFHCDKCSMCMPIAMGNGKHRCIQEASYRNCPVCLEDIHTSRSSSHVPPCGHLLHQQCFDQLIRKALYTCPTCNQSMVDMKLVWKYLDEQLAASPPLPPEFANEVQILCRDCHGLSTVMFHFVGLKCGSCGGYNTCIERGAALNPEAFAMHQQNEEVQVDLPDQVDEEGDDDDDDEELDDDEFVIIGEDDVEDSEDSSDEELFEEAQASDGETPQTSPDTNSVSQGTQNDTMGEGHVNSTHGEETPSTSEGSLGERNPK